VQRVGEGFKDSECLGGRDDDGAVVGLGPHLDTLHRVLEYELMPLADSIDPVHQPVDFAHGCPGKILLVVQGLEPLEFQAA
jgi:hypothetical protein